MTLGRRRPPPFVAHVLELMEPLGPVAARSMFGGWGLSLDGLTFAIIAGEELYLKTDAQNRPAYEDLGLPAFAPYPEQPERRMNYHMPPAEALEDADSLLPWVRAAFEVALRAPRPARKKK
ncbi:TfoX/Sxy family protein [Niveispirillum sp.]|uniref:TfoX/Sxy family protein n=1 Tax=Niveispirillum sp. TaxID=1917217 RepID=UPI001B54250F|nr:TfoX/Sxy family protein [Niveispirillum sp.]MBP7340042.1 TfoX/Sxy family protein [Niveispirillum sp.]